MTVTEAQKQKAEAGRWPSLGLSSNYTRIGPHTSVDMKNMKLVPDPSTGGFKVDLPPTKAGATDTYSTSLNLQLPVYMGGKLASAAEMARLGLHTAEIDYQAEYQNLIYQVIQAYIVLVLMGWWNLARARLNSSKSTRGLIETNLGLGYATKNDLMETQIRVTQAELGTVKAEHVEEVGLENLCIYWGFPKKWSFLRDRY